MWGKWIEWGSCDKCGGQMRRNRQIVQMAEKGGRMCQMGASEETRKCKRQCHKAVYCEWKDWEDEAPCSVSCGVGMIKRVRLLQPTDKAPEVIMDDEIEEHVDDDLQELLAKDQRRRLKQVVMSFACGSIGSFVVFLVLVAVYRSTGRRFASPSHGRVGLVCEPSMASGSAGV